MYADGRWISPAAPHEGAKTVSFTVGPRLRLLGGMMPPAVALDLPLEVVPSPMVGHFFGAVAYWRGFLRMGLVGKRCEYWESTLNESFVVEIFHRE